MDNGNKSDLFERIESARDRLTGVAKVTPVMTSGTLDRMTGAEVFLKCENFQRMGAFKFRGAYNAISRLSAAEKARGVVTFSSGNHAQAVALVGRLIGVETTVVMPADAPRIKREATEAYGAKVIDYDPRSMSREDIAHRLQAEQGAVLIPQPIHLCPESLDLLFDGGWRLLGRLTGLGLNGGVRDLQSAPGA